MEKLTFRCPQNPQARLLDLENACQMVLRDLDVTTNAYSINAIEPTNANGTGIYTCGNSNGALTIVHNIAISGFYTAIAVNEHTSGSDLNLTSNKIGLDFKEAHHASYFARLSAQHNQIQVKVSASHLFEIAQLNMEHVGSAQSPSSAWQVTEYELSDPANVGQGNIRWANVLANTGKVDVFRQNGGLGIFPLRVGEQ